MVAIVAEGVTTVMEVTVAIVVVQMLNTALIPNQHIVIPPAVVVPMQNPLAILIMAADHHQVADHPLEIKYAQSSDMH
jgi:hypothetical protein